MDPIFLPIAKQMVNPEILLIIGGLGGFVSSLLGVGSGIIITPVLMLCGIPSWVAVSSQLHNSLGTSFSGFLNYWRRQDVDLGLSWYLFLGGVIGAILELQFLQWLRHQSSTLALSKILTASVLLILGTQSLAEKPLHKTPKGAMMRHWMIYFPWHKIFIRSRTEMSVLIPFCVGLGTGVMTSSLGGGNSLFIAPILTYLIGRTSAAVTGTALLAGFGINTVVAILHAVNNSPADFILVMFLFLSGTAGSQLGTMVSYKIRRSYLSVAGSLVIFFISFKFFVDLYKNNWKIVNIVPQKNATIFDSPEYLHYMQDLFTPWIVEASCYAQSHPFEYVVFLITSIVATVYLSNTILCFVVENWQVMIKKRRNRKKGQ